MMLSGKESRPSAAPMGNPYVGGFDLQAGEITNFDLDRH
jgi:hypothetical protein